MEVKFKNITKYSEELYINFLEFHNKKFGLKFQIYTILFIILLMYCIIINIKYDNIDVAVIFLIVLGLVIYKRYFSQIKTVKTELESEKISQEQIFTFIFYDKYFKIKGNGEIEKVKYKQIYKTYQTEKYYYLYIDKTHSYILDKNGFTQGKPEEFYTFIKDKKSILKVKNNLQN